MSLSHYHTVKQANKDIDAAKLKLTTEIAAIGEIKTETETTRFYVDYDDLGDAANLLI
ncbi:hemolysin E [Escherichia coli]|nr:hemolysin E [Escherichia coli]